MKLIGAYKKGVKVPVISDGYLKYKYDDINYVKIEGFFYYKLHYNIINNELNGSYINIEGKDIFGIKTVTGHQRQFDTNYDILCVINNDVLADSVRNVKNYILIPYEIPFFIIKNEKIKNEVYIKCLEKFMSSLYTLLRLTSHNEVYKYSDIKNKNLLRFIKRSIKLHSPIYSTNQFPRIPKTGLEIEVNNTRIPNAVVHHFGFVPLKDGSLSYSGVEYTSSPTRSIDPILKFTEYLKYCSIDTKCSIHINMEYCNSKKEIVALYYLYYRLQYEIYQVVPSYISNPLLRGTNKFYAEPLSVYLNDEIGDVDKCYNLIKNYFNTDPANTRFWNDSCRYSVLNFLPIFKGKTYVEFRGFPSSSNVEDIFTYIYLCAAIIKYAQTNVDLLNSKSVLITKITIFDVIKVLDEKLQNYINLALKMRIIENQKMLKKARILSLGQGQNENYKQLMNLYKNKYESMSVINSNSRINIEIEDYQEDYYEF